MASRSPFDLCVGIDYSGAATPDSRLPGLAVYAASDGLPEPRHPPGAGPGKHWARREIADWLVERLASDQRVLVGIDHAFGFPASYLDRYGLGSWDDFLVDFAREWPMDQPDATVKKVGAQPPSRTGKPDEFRLTDRWTSSAKSVFHFDIPGAVAASSHTGIPFLLRIRERVGDSVHFWPFDGWELPEGKSAVVEVYPSILRKRYECPCEDEHERDACCATRWLRDVSDRGTLARYLDPPLTEEERATARREGWILGVT